MVGHYRSILKILNKNVYGTNIASPRLLYFEGVWTMAVVLKFQLRIGILPMFQVGEQLYVNKRKTVICKLFHKTITSTVHNINNDVKMLYLQ